MVRLTRRDWVFIAVCAAVVAASLLIIVRYFGSAFPEASIEFRYDRDTSRPIAESLLAAQKLQIASMKHTVVFDADQEARVFLERTLGLERAQVVMKRDVRIWYWHHRWFRPLQEEEYGVDVAPTGEIVSYVRRIPEAAAMNTVDAPAARTLAEAFLTRIRVAPATLELVTQSERSLPKRVQRIFTWETKSINIAGARYRHTVTVDGDAVSSYAQHLRVPEEWLRSYQDLRSKNAAAGAVDTIFLIVTMIAALVTFIVRLRRGDMHVRFLIITGIIAIILVGGVAANSLPSDLANYDTTSSYPAFIGLIIVRTIISSFGSAMLLIVVCGAGEVLYRERLPQHLAIPRLWSRHALTSKRVFVSLILGYTLVAFFIAYQTGFYIVASKFGAWSPADLPYDDMLNTAFPWIAVLFMGFFPAFSEEFLSRAFSIPFFQRVLRSRVLAILVAGFIWGFGHAQYPNQPFYIRGLEVGIAGVIIGFLMDRFGLVALLIWHYTVDAVYTSLLLFRSGNPYYITTSAVASLVFAIPFIASVFLYIRNRGFRPDDDLTNAALPIAPPPEVVVTEEEVVLPPAIRVTPARVTACLTVVALATVLIAMRGRSPRDVVDYRTPEAQAEAIATAHLEKQRQKTPQTTAATGVSAFRSWDRSSSREEGGAPNGFDDVAATYLIRHGMPMTALIDVMRTEVHAATWMVRFFTPMMKTEYFVEVDPRTSRVIGYHKYADDDAPGARLEREQALQIARAAFATYGVDPGPFELKEALAFQQTNRRDWLFHFEKKPPLAGDAVRRTTVRVMGDEVTQFANTVKVPDEVYREASERRLTNVVLMVVKIAGVIAALALVVTGAVLVLRHGGPMWKRAARVALALSILPILGTIAAWEETMFRYDTSIAWETFRVMTMVSVVIAAGLQILVIFIAVAGITAVYPHARFLATTEARRRFGRSAAVAAATALGALVAARELLRLFARQFPSFASVDEIGIPEGIGIPFPSLFDTAQALLATVVFCGGVTLYVAAVRSWKRPWIAPLVTIAILFAVLMESAARPAELALTLPAALIMAAVLWFVGRRVLDGNPLAWPLAVFILTLLQAAAALAQNTRPDLRIHAGILAAIAVIAIIWVSAPAPAEAAEPA
jgi:membrane protease YdiL (CAAX protease family)